MDNGASSYRRFLDGDESGFTELVEMYAYNLIFFINGFVHNVTTAEDLMEETFCDLIFYKSRFKGKSLFKTYLFSIARNKAVDFVRKNSCQLTTNTDDMEQQSEDFEQLENKVIEDERKMQLYVAMKEINPEYRMILHLLYFEDMTYEQTAYVLKKNNKQIKNLAYRAKQTLKATMEKEGFVYEE
jgi:RNA polymerase sigma factor (sigma-70 family)